jgi:hypothetical protein
MIVHVLSGCRRLLAPERLEPEAAISLIGPGIRIPSGGWISRAANDHYHSYLQDERHDRRTEVMAIALREEFGTRNEPLLILPGLLDEIAADDLESTQPGAGSRRTQWHVLSEILESGYVDQMRLYGVAIPAKADPDGVWAVPAGMVPGTVRSRIEQLRESLEGTLANVETRVIEATPDLETFETLYSNALSNALSERLAPKLEQHGWRVDPTALPGVVSRILIERRISGLSPSLPLTTATIDEIGALIEKTLL